MGRIVNQETFLAKLAAANAAERGLTRRELGGTAVVQTELGTTKTRMPGRGAKARVTLPAPELFQLLVGFLSTDELTTNRAIKATGDAEALFRYLVSPLEPHMYAVDHF